MNWRKIFFGLAILLFCAVLTSRFAQAQKLLLTLQHGRPQWVLAAVLLEIAALVNGAALYQALYAALGLPSRLRDLLPVVLAGHFANVVTPSAGLGGAALLLDDARRRGLDLGRVTLANTLFFVLNFVWFSILLVCGLVMLWQWRGLKSYEVVAASVLLAHVALAVGTLILVSARPALFERWLCGLALRVNRIGRRWFKRDVLADATLTEFARQFSGAAQRLRRGHGLGRSWIHAMLVDSLAIAILGACFAAFPGAGRPVTFGMLVTGYGIGTLFLVMSVTPQGLGVVEGVMTAVFLSLGLSLERSAVAVLVYRGLSFWLPLLIGFGALRWTSNLRTNIPMELPSPSGHNSG